MTISDEAPASSIRGQVATRRQTPRDAAIDLAVTKVKKQIEEYKGWFDKVAPSHISSDQFVELCLSVVRRGKPELHAALWQHPGSFFTAVAECARLGLVPGDNYYFVPFKDNRDKAGGKPNPDKGTYSITGMRSYKGEMDLIYRAGGVTAIHCYLVREKDAFDWAPGMVLPAHEIPKNKFGQRGLGVSTDRGCLTGVWCFGVMATGGPSQPIVMGYEEVLKYRAKAKTFEFWGPMWPQEGPWTPDMWKKTGIHRLYPIVPHSAEYRDAAMRSLAVVQGDPLPVPGVVIPSSIEETMEDMAELESAGDSAAQSAGDPS
jgi:recombination protein RecT